MNYYIYKLNKDIIHESIWLRRPLQPEDRRYPLMLRYAGYSRCLAGWQHYRKLSDIFAIEYVCAGNAFLIQNGKEYIINKGEIYILRKGAEHTYGTGPAGFLLKRFIAFDGMESESLLPMLKLWDKDIIHPQESRLTARLLKQFTDLLLHPNGEKLDFRLSCMLYQLLLILFQSSESGTPVIIEKAIEYIQNNLHHSLSRKELSSHLGISIRQCNTMFFTHFGCSPIHYFIQRKMNWAAQLILHTKYNMKEIAGIIGYEDPLYFSAQFKKYFKIAPKKYRLQNKA